MNTSKPQKVSWPRIVLGSLLIAILAFFHANFLFQGNGVGIVFLIVLVGVIYLSKKQPSKAELKHMQYKTASILSFLLPVSALIFSFVFTGIAVESEVSEAAQAGAAIGGTIGGGIVVFFSFLIGISLGIVFYLMSKPKNQ